MLKEKRAIQLFLKSIAFILIEKFNQYKEKLSDGPKKWNQSKKQLFRRHSTILITQHC